MFYALLIAVLAVATSKWLNPGPAFMRGFASLLARREHKRARLLGWLAGKDYVGGELDGRPAMLIVHARRHYRMGYLIVGLATTSTREIQPDDPRTIDAWLSIPGAREAFDALIGRHHLTLALERGWLKATWQPMGFFIFPGRFDHEKWRDVLVHMQTIARGLESTAAERATTSFSEAAAHSLG